MRTIPGVQVVNPPGTLVDLVLAKGREIHFFFDAFTQHAPKWLEGLASVLGLEGTGPVHLRVRIYDK